MQFLIQAKHRTRSDLPWRELRPDNGSRARTERQPPGWLRRGDDTRAGQERQTLSGDEEAAVRVVETAW